MDGIAWSLVLSAAAIGLTHTALGPDHYLPFVMLARARGWSVARTATVTAACGVGHVASSVLLGGVGLIVGVSISGLESIEAGRGNLAAWLLVAFGLAYGVWGLRRAARHSRGLEAHSHGQHVHLHARGDRPHEHDRPGLDGAAFWPLFIVFVLGPCEPLIPLFVLPASRGRWALAALTALVFGLVTVVTMVALTLLAAAGSKRFDFGPLEKWSHSLAGAIIAASGLAILLLGW